MKRSILFVLALWALALTFATVPSVPPPDYPGDGGPGA